MALRAATMSQISHTDNPPTMREPDNLSRKLVLLLLLSSAAALWIAIMFKGQTDFPLLLSTFFADATLGLIAGLGTRFALRYRDGFIRILFAILATIVGMMLIGSFSKSVLGVGPIHLDRKVTEQIHKITLDTDFLDQVLALKIDARTLLDLSKLDWADPVHLAVSLLMTGLALYAWRPVHTPVIVEPLEVEYYSPPPVTTESIRGASNGRARVHLPESGLLLQPTPARTPQPRTRSNNGSRPMVKRAAKRVKGAASHTKSRRSRRKAAIQFASVVEEHRCPYCLDTVTRADPRGVKECEVCRSLHHADCWAITGMCQVPHLN